MALAGFGPAAGGARCIIWGKRRYMSGKKIAIVRYATRLREPRGRTVGRTCEPESTWSPISPDRFGVQAYCITRQGTAGDLLHDVPGRSKRSDHSMLGFWYLAA